MEAAEKFGENRAAEYVVQSEIALAGYRACHELTACLLAAAVGEDSSTNVLVVGAGGPGLEVIESAKLGERWRFVAVEPSEPMMAIARDSIEKAGCSERTRFFGGYVDELDADERFDAVIMSGVFHHVAGDAAKLALLRSIASRLVQGAPLFMSGNRYRYTDKPIFLKAWANRWRLRGLPEDVGNSKLETILKGADPPGSDEEVERFLEQSGFAGHQKYFSSLFWSSWITYRS